MKWPHIDTRVGTNVYLHRHTRLVAFSIRALVQNLQDYDY